jgi:hypothetical protein
MADRPTGLRAVYLWAVANRTLLNLQLGRRFLQVSLCCAPRLLKMAPDWRHPARVRLVQLAWWRPAA